MLTKDMPLVDRLMKWLAVYVVIFVTLGAIFGEISSVLPVLTHLITGISSAAFAIMRVTQKEKDKEDDDT